jgi:hypothetical protein
MKKFCSMLTLLVCSVLSSTALHAQDTPSVMRILSKDATGWITRTALTLTLRANEGHDQSVEALPDGTQLVVNDLVFLTDDTNLGVVWGSLQINSPAGVGLQTMTLRGTFGINARREADKSSRYDHLEAVLEPVPTFAPVHAPQIALAHLSADLIPETAGPLPTYRAKLDGVITLPQAMNNTVTVSPDQTTYSLEDAITVVVANNTDQAIMADDLQSYCTIVRLQRQEGEQWEDVGECLLKRRSFPIKIEAGETKRIELPGRDTPRDTRKPGNYRLLFGYIVGADERGENRQVLSSVFRVN